jgi:hypothetical protein
MTKYLSQPSVPNLSFVVNRIGVSGVSSCRHAPRPSYRQRLKVLVKQRGIFHASQHIGARLATKARDAVLRILLGADFENLRLGRFRIRGEVHQWMYDRFSLKMLLEQAGFCEIRTYSALESRIGNWSEYHLDTGVDGTAYKPDSLYMEAAKPE